jgi:hypothetical protein
LGLLGEKDKKTQKLPKLLKCKKKLQKIIFLHVHSAISSKMRVKKNIISNVYAPGEQKMILNSCLGLSSFFDILLW